MHEREGPSRTSIRYRSDTFASDQYLVDVDPRVFSIWAVFMMNTMVADDLVVQGARALAALVLT